MEYYSRDEKADTINRVRGRHQRSEECHDREHREGVATESHLQRKVNAALSADRT